MLLISVLNAAQIKIVSKVNEKPPSDTLTFHSKYPAIENVERVSDILLVILWKKYANEYEFWILFKLVKSSKITISRMILASSYYLDDKDRSI